jgi:hypothetical protein
MAGVISSGNHPAALWPGIKAWFGLKYIEHAQQFPKLFDVKPSDQAYEEIIGSSGFGLAPLKTQGGAVMYDSHQQGPTARFTNAAYALGYIVTREELADGKYEKVSNSRAGSLAFSVRQTEENVGAQVYNRGFDSNYVGADGVELFSTAHTLALGGTFSNELDPAADFSEASLEDLAVQIMNAVNPRNLKISLMPKRLIVPTALVFEAERVLASTLTPSSANNAVNALKSMGVIPEVAVNHYLTDTDAFFIKTNAEEGMLWFDRELVDFSMDSDFDTDNAKAKVYRRFVAGWADPRGAFGAAGA